MDPKKYDFSLFCLLPFLRARLASLFSIQFHEFTITSRFCFIFNSLISTVFSPQADIKPLQYYRVVPFPQILLGKDEHTIFFTGYLKLFNLVPIPFISIQLPSWLIPYLRSNHLSDVTNVEDR